MSSLGPLRRALARMAPAPQPDAPWLVIRRSGGKVAGRWAVVAVRLGEVLKWRTTEEAQPWLDAQQRIEPLKVGAPPLLSPRAITDPSDSEAGS
jgi:hypothetical protein